MALFFYRHQCIVGKKYKLISCILLLLFVVLTQHIIVSLLTEFHRSLWPELLRKVCLLLSQLIWPIQKLAKFNTTFTYSVIFKQNPEAMELLRIPNVYYFPASFMSKIPYPRTAKNVPESSDNSVIHILSFINSQRSVAIFRWPLQLYFFLFP
uniref:Ovule protein n=1 Tax=Heterorhabditis bacteriophora TaxID=37862 RepID=A0A1I7WQJ8_HETBA